MFDLKPLSKEAVPAALEKAIRYRLLNEPAEAESICLDVLRVDSENQQAVVILLLALSDQFDGDVSCVERARDLVGHLTSEYDRHYYRGIICERRAKAFLHAGAPGAASAAYEWLEEAMDWYQRAEAIRPERNDDALLRWNACGRLIMRHHLSPRAEERFEPSLE